MVVTVDVVAVMAVSVEDAAPAMVAPSSCCMVLTVSTGWRAMSPTGRREWCAQIHAYGHHAAYTTYIRACRELLCVGG